MASSQTLSETTRKLADAEEVSVWQALTVAAHHRLILPALQKIVDSVKKAGLVADVLQIMTPEAVATAKQLTKDALENAAAVREALLSQIDALEAARALQAEKRS